MKIDGVALSACTLAFLIDPTDYTCTVAYLSKTLLPVILGAEGKTQDWGREKLFNISDPKLLPLYSLSGRKT